MRKFLLLIVIICWFPFKIFAQIDPDIDILGKDDPNVITTAVPFLMIAPDSRSGAMGDIGVASSPDVNSQHWNPAKYIFTDDDYGFALSYTPWLQTLVDDMSLSYLAGYTKISDQQALGFSLLYFSLGNITFRDESGYAIREHSPNEFALDVSYSLLLSENFSGAVALRYIYSNLTGGQIINSTEESHAGHAFAGDIAFYYHKNFIINENDATLAIGTHISNMGTKISYTDSRENFIPINMRFGASFKLPFDEYNSLTFLTDFNKLLVPTPPEYDGLGTAPENIVEGKDPDVSTAVGIFQSFSDAPNGAIEELHEISISAGLEYWYADKFAIRTGYFHEHETKGNRKYFTLGLGLRLNVFSLDFSYLVPTQQHNPLQNTLRFTLGLNFEKMKNE